MVDYAKIIANGKACSKVAFGPVGSTKIGYAGLIIVLDETYWIGLDVDTALEISEELKVAAAFANKINEGSLSVEEIEGYKPKRAAS